MKYEEFDLTKKFVVVGGKPIFYDIKVVNGCVTIVTRPHVEIREYWTDCLKFRIPVIEEEVPEGCTMEDCYLREYLGNGP
jgi:hypothetical protein